MRATCLSAGMSLFWNLEMTFTRLFESVSDLRREITGRQHQRFILRFKIGDDRVAFERRSHCDRRFQCGYR